MALLSGKKILVTGVLSNRSIAYGIAKAARREGAEIALTYQNERFKDRVTEMAKELGSDIALPCEVTSDAEIESLFDALGQRWKNLDGLVHAIAFAPREAIAGDFLEGISREAFRQAHDISSYSFAALAKGALPLLQKNSSLVTLTYLGAERVVPNYNTMGLAKASLEASVRYLAASLGRTRHPGERHLSRADQDAGRSGHLGLQQDPQVRRRACAPAAQRDHRGCRKCGRVPDVRSGGGDHRRDHLRRRRLQPRRGRHRPLLLLRQTPRPDLDVRAAAQAADEGLVLRVAIETGGTHGGLRIGLLGRLVDHPGNA